ncbi:hypothetical protein DL98DRAFT_515795 [Cadophora sp. DSE1049]|nr:hypothetical protein DL98DRAFT_515795 [Cadophora sp. DSE1049]
MPGQTSLQWLMTWVMWRSPDQMGKLDKSKRTPLTAAIASRNETFVLAYTKISNVETSKKIQHALKTTECFDHDSDRDDTCLHAAITYGLRGELAMPLVELVPKEMFCVQDAKGRTPLHLAVDYERSRAEQVTIVSKLLRLGPEALEVRMEQDSLGRRLSAYQYHEVTRRKYKIGNPPLIRPPERKPGLDMSLEMDEREKAKLQQARSAPEGPETGSQRSRFPVGLRNDAHRERGPGEEAGKRRDSEVPPTPIQIAQDTMSLGSVVPSIERSQTNRGINSPTPQHRSNYNNQAKQELERSTSADQIREMLKLAYLRMTRPRVAFQCLHMQDQRDKELWFNFGPKPKTKLTPAEFVKNFEHLEFEKMLQYVALPQVELSQENNASGSRYQGRTDMIFFFNWLRSKGVERIVRVIVDDLGESFHSDEAIEEALRNFEVEVLDWRRLDLCPVTVSKISKNLREIYLQWSGKNATLRAWSATDGLAKTASLKTIHLIQVKALDSENRVQDNLKEFENRLNASWPGEKKPVFDPRKSSGDALRTTSVSQPATNGTGHPRTSNVDPHKWLQCMDEFATWMKKIKGLKAEQEDPVLNPVTVALIDDGVEITHEDLRSQKLSGKSFDYYQDDWLVSPYWNSASGHGTLMARLIQRVCPSAVIYVIKLKTFNPDGSSKLRIDASSAIQAIEHATELGAQIISMSWTVKPPEKTKTTDRKADFDNAIQTAANKGVLMFCSANDQGHSQEDFTYPHSSNTKLTFRVGAAKATGDIADFVGNYSKIDFAFPGHDVVLGSNNLAAEEFHDFESHTGSSVATALASGLAALIFECVRLGVLHTNLDQAGQADPTVAITKDDILKIRTRENMALAFGAISTGQQTYSKYVEVRDTFRRVAELLKNEEGNTTSQLEVIAGLARILLRKGVR